MPPHVHTPLPNPHGETHLASSASSRCLTGRCICGSDCHVPGGNEIDVLLVPTNGSRAFAIETKGQAPPHGAEIRP